jgi:hypothetical protein
MEKRRDESKIERTFAGYGERVSTLILVYKIDAGGARVSQQFFFINFRTNKPILEHVHGCIVKRAVV